jgi:RNA polymerase sigma-70 factor (ECF subfamily)
MSQNKQLFLTLYEPVHQSFERFCKARSYGQMPFKDLMQETLLIAYTKFEHLKEPDKFLYYLFGIATRILSNQRKKVQYEALTEMQSARAIIQPAADRRAETEQLYKALSMLPIEQREALILYEIIGFSIKEIAGFQQKSEEAIRQQLSRGRKKLLSLLSPNTESKDVFYE